MLLFFTIKLVRNVPRKVGGDRSTDVSQPLVLKIKIPITSKNVQNRLKCRNFVLQGGESIDFTWSRYKVNKKVLKIRSAELEDTGVFNCKGINGFGSDNVRLELIIVGELIFC